MINEEYLKYIPLLPVEECSEEVRQFAQLLEHRRREAGVQQAEAGPMAMLDTLNALREEVRKLAAAVSECYRAEDLEMAYALAFAQVGAVDVALLALFLAGAISSATDRVDAQKKGPRRLL